MRVLSFYLPGLLLLCLAVSCKKNVAPVTVGRLTFNQESGTDCDKADTLARVDCARLQLQWPQAQDGSNALKKSVDQWATAYLNNLLAAPSAGEPIPASTVAAAAKSFFDAHKQEEKSAMTGGWTGESNYRVLLNDGHYLTLEITGSTYQGGAHGSYSAAVATFETASGRQLTWADLVTDQAALKSLAEKTFRETRTDLFEPIDTSLRFSFGPDNPFTLPQQYGLAEAGIYCHYVPYEVGPYAIGSTQMLIPFEKLGALAKIAPPPNAPKPVNTLVLPDYSPQPAPAPEEPVKPVAKKPDSSVKHPSAAPATAPKKEKVSKPAAPAAPSVTLKQNGNISIDGKKVADLEDLRKQLQARLLTYAVIPEQIGFKTVGQTGMGMRAEIKTILSESVAGAKWIRKKTAIEALNVAVGKKLALSTKLELGTYQTKGGFAYLSARPAMKDGRPIDYNRTDYAKDLREPWFADNAIGLLHWEKGAWKVLAYTIGVRQAPVDVWVKKFGASRALFK